MVAMGQICIGASCSPVHLKVLQRARLRHLVENAQRRSPWMGKRLSHIDPVRAPLESLPVMHRAQAMNHFDDWLTDRSIKRRDLEAFISDLSKVGQPFGAGHAVWSSSGTSGTPGLFIHDPSALAIYDALEMVRCNWPSWPILPRWSPWPLSGWPWPSPADRYAVVCMTGGHFATLASVQRLRRSHPWLQVSVQPFDGMLSLEQLVPQLNQFAPQWLASYPSTADLLSDAQASGELKLRLRGIWTGGETLDPATRARLCQRFDCPVRDDYGASECLPIAWECPEGALHVNEDWVLLEPVDHALQPVPPGVMSATVLLTNLANHLQPLIRYDLGDRITRLPLPCPCGSPFMAIHVDGRDDDIVELTDTNGRVVRIAPLVLVGALEDRAGVHAFQVVRRDANTLELRLDPLRESPDAALRATRALSAILLAHGLSETQILKGSQKPQCHPRSGKLRRIVAHGD